MLVEKVDKKINIINRAYIFEHSHNFLSALRIYSPSLSLTNWISTTRLLSFFAKLLRSSFSLLPVFLDDQRDWSSSHRISIFPFSIFQAFSLRSLLFVAEVILYSIFPLLFAYHLLLPSNKNHCVTTIHTFFFSFFSFPFFFLEKKRTVFPRIFPEFFRSERIFSRESLHVSYNF